MLVLTSHIRGSEEELRSVLGHKRSMSSTFLLCEHVDLCLELGMTRDGSRFGDEL